MELICFLDPVFLINLSILFFLSEYQELPTHFKEVSSAVGVVHKVEALDHDKNHEFISVFILSNELASLSRQGGTRRKRSPTIDNLKM